MATLITEVVEIFEPLAAEANVSLATDVSDGLPMISGDEARLHQVLDNLIANAIRHSYDGGVVTVSAKQDGNRLCLSVSDTGDGIERDKLAVIFDRFARADKNRSHANGSTGLGLTITKAIVEAHGGHIWAESVGLGNGSCFSIALPFVVE